MITMSPEQAATILAASSLCSLRSLYKEGRSASRRMNPTTYIEGASMHWCPICRASGVFPGEMCPHCGNQIGAEPPAWVGVVVLTLVGLACILAILRGVELIGIIQGAVK